MYPEKLYEEFLKGKVVIAEKFGIETENLELTEKLFPHQKDIVKFCLEGGRRAIFASFGLGKTFMQLEIAKQLIKITNKPFLIVCPLGVSGEFKRDNRKLNTGFDITYITDTDDFENENIQIYLTNYERVRKGDIDPSLFCGVSFDEASILRNLQTETTQYVLSYFKKVPFRFVATATPTPNDFIEILNYADYLGVISRGHALTRFFQRDSTKAGNLKLYENKKDEFWKWVSTWAVFINTPADLGYDDGDYILPELNIIEHCISYDAKEQPKDKWGTPILFKDLSKSLLEVSREKRDSLAARINKATEIAESINENVIIWHHLEAERQVLESDFKGESFASVYGSLPNEEKEKLLIDFSEGKYKYLLTKPKIAGSGCNFQDYCSDMIFAGIDYKFNDFIQAIHRCYRFGQKKQVNVHIIYTENEYEVLKTLKAKWAKHIELNKQMIALVKENGLNSEIIKSQMARQVFANGKKVVYDNVTLYNNDTVIVHADKKEMPDNSVDMILTSIPFGDHYEYSDNYNDFGHNHGNDNFFKQMDFLTPNLLRVLKPGRIAAIHVKDRIRYSYQNGTSFTTIADFSGQTVAHFTKESVKKKIDMLDEIVKGLLKKNMTPELATIIDEMHIELHELRQDYQDRFYLMGKITVTTDVVAENNQTYRLGWTEQCKDATKMGVGLPEYVLIFRKAPSEMNNAYADYPVIKEKSDYTKARWQLDAHAYYRSNGNRFLTKDELQSMEVKRIVAAWKRNNEKEVYDFNEHLRVCEDMDEAEKLSSTFMTLPVHSNNDLVWTDVNRMNTLNAKQVNAKKEKHICPLQFDIIERLIERYTMPGELIDDPFGGLFSTPYKALELGRKSVAVELNSEYFADGHYYIKAMMHKLSVPTLFDLLTEDKKEAV
jgi:DNA modification methylase